MILDTRRGDAVGAVVGIRTFLGLGDKYVAVRVTDLAPQGDRLVSPYSKRELQRAANFQLTSVGFGPH